MKRTVVRLVVALRLAVGVGASLVGRAGAAPMHDPNGFGHQVTSPQHDPN